MWITSKMQELNKFLVNSVPWLNQELLNFLQFLILGLINIPKPSLLKIQEYILDSLNLQKFYRLFNQLSLLNSQIYLQIFLYFQRNQKMAMKPNAKLIVDEHIIPRTGSKMEGGSVQFATALKKTTKAHSIMVLYYWDGNKRYPVDYKFYRREEELKNNGIINLYKKKNQLVRDLIKDSLNYPNLPRIIVMDSFFFCKENVKFLNKYKFKYISRPKKSMKVRTGKQWENLRNFISQIPISDYNNTPIYNRLSNRTNYALIAVKDVIFHSLKQHRIVIIKHQINRASLPKSIEEDVEDFDSFQVFVTNELSWTGRHILESYRTRWAIETFFEDLSQNMGLHSGKWRKLEQQETWIYICFLCYFFLFWLKIFHHSFRDFQYFISLGTLIKKFRKLIFQELINYILDPSSIIEDSMKIS